MTVYDLIKELVYYPPNMEVFAEVGATQLRFDVGGTELELRHARPENNRVVIILDP